MTNQEIFDKAVLHCLKQGKRAVMAQFRPDINEYISTCCYRAGDLKCAIGSLIPDDVYSPEMESTIIGDLLQNPKISELFASVDSDLLTDIQLMHDTIPEGSDFRKFLIMKATTVAKTYNLSTTVIDNWSEDDI